jgi:hypothetical protein
MRSQCYSVKGPAVYQTPADVPLSHSQAFGITGLDINILGTAANCSLMNFVTLVYKFITAKPKFKNKELHWENLW